jgi:hypothetical protein
MEDNHQEDSQMVDLGSTVSSPPSSNHQDVEMQHDNCSDLTSIATFEIDKSPDSLSNVQPAMSYSMSWSVNIDLW